MVYLYFNVKRIESHKNIHPIRSLKKMKTTYISDSTHKKLRIKCAENDLPIAQLADRIIDKWLDSDDSLGVISSLVDENKEDFEISSL